jgi:hypothetical protein
MNKCDVCGNTENVGVAASSLTAGSFTYCSECLLVNAEPYDIIVGLFIGSNVGEIGLETELERYDDWVKTSVYNSLKKAGKSVGELTTDVQLANAELMAYLTMEDFEDVEVSEEEVQEIEMMFNSIDDKENI